MKVKELRDLSVEELRTKEAELRDQVFKLRFQKTLGQLENPLKIRNLKREIARIRTLLKERESETA